MPRNVEELSALKTKAAVIEALKSAHPDIFDRRTIHIQLKQRELSIYWFDGYTQSEVQAICKPFERRPLWQYPEDANKTFRYKGQEYRSQIECIRCGRTETPTFVKRCAALICKQYQIPLPVIRYSKVLGTYIISQVEVQSGQGSRPLKDLIYKMAEATSEADLARQEQEPKSNPIR